MGTITGVKTTEKPEEPGWLQRGGKPRARMPGNQKEQPGWRHAEISSANGVLNLRRQGLFWLRMPVAGHAAEVTLIDWGIASP